MPPKPNYLPLNPQDKYAGFMLQAPSMQRLFVEAALVLTEHLVTVPAFKEAEKKVVELQADSPAALMNAWLVRVADIFSEDSFGCYHILFESFDGKKLRAVLWGETYQPLRHGTKMGIRTVSCQKIEACSGEDGFRVSVKMGQSNPKAA